MSRSAPHALLRFVLPVVLLLAAVAIGFLAGRRQPLKAVNGLVPRRFGHGTGWIPFPAGPGPRYEATTAVVGRSLYVLGGFTDQERHASASVFRWDPGSGRWSRMADMPTPTTHRNAAIIGDTVWLAGGFVGKSPGPATDEVWAWIPDQDEWLRGPPLPKRLASGGLAAVGRELHYFSGYGDDRQTAVPDHWVIRVEDAVAGRTTWRATTPFPLPRGHLATVVLGDYVYAIGGTIRHDPQQVDVKYVHRFDPGSDTWTEVASLPEPRSHVEPGTFVRNGRIYVIGGRSWPTYQQSMTSVTIYYPDLDLWLAGPPLPRPLMAPVGGALGDSVIVGLGAEEAVAVDSTFWVWEDRAGWWQGASLPAVLQEVAGGIVGSRMILVGHPSERTLIYDLGTGRWEQPGRAARRPAPGRHHAAEVLDGELYLLGGDGRAAGIMQIYNPERNEWRFGPDLPFSAGRSASAVIGGRLYVAGGETGDSTIGTLARYDPATGEWAILPPMRFERKGAAAATDGRRFFVFGGRGPREEPNGGADADAVVQIYDPATDSWIVPGTAGTAHFGPGKAAYITGEFWVLGGEASDGSGAADEGERSRVEIFDPITNRWRSGPPLPTPRRGIFPLAIGDRIYVGGGASRAGSSGSDVLEILTAPRK